VLLDELNVGSAFAGMLNFSAIDFDPANRFAIFL